MRWFWLLKRSCLSYGRSKCKIPQIGWNVLESNHPQAIFKENTYVYYVHSYYAKDMDDQDLIGYSMYGSMKIPGLVMHDHIMGCQFHPEKVEKMD